MQFTHNHRNEMGQGTELTPLVSLPFWTLIGSLSILKIENFKFHSVCVLVLHYFTSFSHNILHSDHSLSFVSREHQLAVRQLQQCVADGVDVGDRQDHLKEITERMESKAEHIRIVKRQISTLQKHKQDRGSKKVKGTKPTIDLDSPSNRRDMLKDMAHYEDRDLHSTSDREQPSIAKRNLSMLRNMRNLQVTLQRDDIWWE